MIKPEIFNPFLDQGDDGIPDPSSAWPVLIGVCAIAGVLIVVGLSALWK